jgi:hypothetical protein
VRKRPEKSPRQAKRLIAAAFPFVKWIIARRLLAVPREQRTAELVRSEVERLITPDSLPDLKMMGQWNLAQKRSGKKRHHRRGSAKFPTSALTRKAESRGILLASTVACLFGIMAKP